MSTKVRDGQNVFGNACGTPASTKKHFSLVAGFPQAPKSGFSLLRDSRKRQKAVFPRCGNPAKPKKHFFLIAEIPQAPKSSFSLLRDSRKHFRKHFGCPSTLTKIWCGRKEPHSYVELTLNIGSEPNRLGSEPNHLGSGPKNLGPGPNHLGSEPKNIVIGRNQLGSGRNRILIAHRKQGAPPAEGENLRRRGVVIVFRGANAASEINRYSTRTFSAWPSAKRTR